MAENKRWYLLKVRSTFEPLVERELTKRKFETFLPESGVLQNRPSRVKRLLFPGHIFCRFDLDERIRVSTIPGVQCVLGLPEPLSCDDGEFSALQTAINSDLPYEIVERRSGQPVRMFTGPLRGAVGTLFDRRGHRQFGVNVKVLGRMLLFDVGNWSYRPLPCEPRPLIRAARVQVQPTRLKASR